MSDKKGKTTSERIAVIETKLSNVEENLNKIDSKLSKFIDCADKKYATKEELNGFRQHCIRQQENSRSWAQWLPSLLAVIIAAIALIL